MNRSTPRTFLVAIGTLSIAALALSLSGTAVASQVLVHTTFPEGVAVGETLDLPVTAQAASGTPMEGVAVDLYVRASFAGVVDDIAIGRAVTDEAGVARLSYVPRLAGHNELRVEYVTPDGSEVEESSVTVDLVESVALYPIQHGLDIPGLNVGLVMAVLTTVWTILLGIALMLVAIAHMGRGAGGFQEQETG